MNCQLRRILFIRVNRTKNYNVIIFKLYIGIHLKSEN